MGISYVPPNWRGEPLWHRARGAHLEAQCAPDQCVCGLDPIRLCVFGAVPVWETLQIESREKLHGHDRLQQGAARRDVHHLHVQEK